MVLCLAIIAYVRLRFWIRVNSIVCTICSWKNTWNLILFWIFYKTVLLYKPCHSIVFYYDIWCNKPQWFKRTGGSRNYTQHIWWAKRPCPGVKPLRVTNQRKGANGFLRDQVKRRRRDMSPRHPAAMNTENKLWCESPSRSFLSNWKSAVNGLFIISFEFN